MKKLKILFLCTGNSARGIFAEYILQKRNPFEFEAFSAGSNPKSGPHPVAIQVLKDSFGIDASQARSKSLTTYADKHFDIIITVCDNAKETCPVWPAKPIVAHWGSPDPAAFIGDEEATYKCFKDVALQIARRIDIMLALPLERLQNYRPEFEQSIKEIGTKE